MFATLNAEVVALRNSLRAFVSEEALHEINVLPPAGDADEASFMRLVIWSYVLLFEAGRITIPYLLQLSNETSRTEASNISRNLIRSLRTWIAHNLGGSERDRAISRDVIEWFQNHSSRYPPNTNDEWQNCFASVCSEVYAIVTCCQSSVEVFSASDDGQDNIAALQQRLKRSWPLWKFHKIVSNECVILGAHLDVHKFCEIHISKWRKYLETVPNDDDLQVYMTRIIERDILHHIEGILPINGQDVMNSFDDLDPGPTVGKILSRAREICRQENIRDRESLLDILHNDCLVHQIISIT